MIEKGYRHAIYFSHFGGGVGGKGGRSSICNGFNSASSGSRGTGGNGLDKLGSSCPESLDDESLEIEVDESTVAEPIWRVSGVEEVLGSCLTKGCR